MVDSAIDGDMSPISVPADFPVTWENPEDERRLWTVSGGNGFLPEQMKPLIVGVRWAHTEGFHQASEWFGLSFGSESRRINTYIYTAMLPASPAGQREALAEQSEKRLRAAIARLRELWETEFLPEVREHLAAWEAFDLRDSTAISLAAHLGDTWQRSRRLWEIKFSIALPFIQAQSEFADFYGEVFEEGTLEAYRLLQGFGNKTVEGGHALWDLSRGALDSPPVRRILEDNGPAAVPAALESSPEGRIFLAGLVSYLEEYGQRSDIYMAVDNPHWIENPITPITILKDFIARPERNPRAALVDLIEERERLIGIVRDRLKGHSQPVAERFEFLLEAAQAGAVIQEEQNYWIDQRSVYKVRQVLIECGRRLAEAGVIEEPDDVFYLFSEELEETVAVLPGGNQRQLVRERKAEMAHFLEVKRPDALGTRPTGSPTSAPETALGRAFSKYGGVPVPESQESNVLHGNPSSPGKVKGTARLVPTLAEAVKLQPGDILVAQVTAPPWTPLFATVAAVVMDKGGVLSHAAIVAREYNVPAVLGTGNATRVIRDGQTIEVDGDSGVVHIVS